MKNIAKPKEDYLTDEYIELDLPVAPAVMVGEEILVEGADITQIELEAAICRRLGLPAPEPAKKGLMDRLLKRP